MWVTKLLISPVKKGFFAQKRPNLAQNWHFWLIWAWPCRFFWCPVGGSVGGCGARAVSRKTPIYFIIFSIVKLNIMSYNVQSSLIDVFSIEQPLQSKICNVQHTLHLVKLNLHCKAGSSSLVHRSEDSSLVHQLSKRPSPTLATLLTLLILITRCDACTF